MIISSAQHYSLSALITAIADFILLVAIFLKATDRRLVKRFCIYAFAIAHWSFFVYWCTVVNDQLLSYRLSQLCHLGGVFIPVAFLHFVYEYTQVNAVWVRRLLHISYGVIGSIALSIILAPKLFIPDVVPKLSFNFFPNPGPLFVVWNIVFVVIVAVTFWILYTKSKLQTGNERKATLFFLVANILGYTGGIGCFLPVYDISVFPFPFGIWGVFFFTCVTAFSVMKYQFLEIEVFVRRATVFAGLFAFTYAVFSTFTLIGQRYFEAVLGWDTWVAMIPTISVIIFTLRPIENFLTEATEKYLFQKEYDYKELLRMFTTEVLTILNLQELPKKTIKGLNSIIKLESASIALLNHETGKYEVKSSQGLKETDLVFTADDPLVYYLNMSHKYIKKGADIQQMNGHGRKMSEDFKKLKAELCLPLVFHNKLIGFISLGMKKSGDDYNEADVDILMSLAATVAIAISNAELFDELSKTQAEAAQREKMAVVGTLAAGINHEICNPLGIVRGQCEMFLLNYRDGLYKDKSDKEIVEQVVAIMNKVIKETDRATAITKRLSSFAKPSKNYLRDEVCVPDEITEVLAILGQDLKLNNINIELKFPDTLPQIYADRKQLQEILFNIIRNGAQAMTNGSGIIELTGYGRDERVIIKIRDSGSGIPEEKIGQIFNPFFTTKAPGKGTGLGLFIVKQIIERNKGTIAVESEPGVGTTFTLTFEAVPNTAVNV